nr:MAG TPA: integral membrane protein [Caudoviricetes sp.]
MVWLLLFYLFHRSNCNDDVIFLTKSSVKISVMLGGKRQMYETLRHSASIQIANQLNERPGICDNLFTHPIGSAIVSNLFFLNHRELKELRREARSVMPDHCVITISSRTSIHTRAARHDGINRIIALVIDFFRNDLICKNLVMIGHVISPFLW